MVSVMVTRSESSKDPGLATLWALLRRTVDFLSGAEELAAGTRQRLDVQSAAVEETLAGQGAAVSAQVEALEAMVA